ncbi:MAG TPA: D-alanyl-D-alanine carboxypeptidase [Pyrinomonadaceae bacterium]|nr:D-alanyl-D-alanine carboxypeptidase [Pyrinomonadaceae bacterium]
MAVFDEIRWWKTFACATIIFVALTVDHVAVGQELPKPLPSPSPAASLPQPAQPADVTGNQSSDQAERPLYGLQGVLVETIDGRQVASQSIDQQFNPASNIKLATALIALQTFGPDHRFATGVWTDGTFDKATGKIEGNLYISGRDPSFHYEHAIMIARELNGLGIKEVAGDLYVAPGFTMNFSSSAQRSGEQLYDTLDSSLRTGDAITAWNQTAKLQNHSNPEPVPSVAVMGGVDVSPVAPTAKLLMTHKSSKLIDILKVLLCYSNNFMAARIGESLGGTDSVQQQLINRLGVGPTEIRLSSLSGLGVNRVSPRVMMKIFRGLRAELAKHGLDPSAIMPVAGIDPGTLEDRFSGVSWRGSVIAKTGTLVRTDGGTSSLVGQMKTASGEVLLFVIMNQSGSISRFRENQDYLVMLIQNTRGGPRAFDYKPVTMAMQLSHTESTVAVSDEYEPKPKQ